MKHFSAIFLYASIVFCAAGCYVSARPEYAHHHHHEEHHEEVHHEVVVVHRD
jgi:hypothetical protein